MILSKFGQIFRNLFEYKCKVLNVHEKLPVNHIYVDRCLATKCILQGNIIT